MIVSLRSTADSRAPSVGPRFGYFGVVEPNDPTSSLNDNDLLSLSIGRVVRAHSRVEYGLRNVREALDTGTQVGGFVGAEQLVKECSTRLRLVDLSPEVMLAGERSLEAARASNALRNTTVHDLWLLESDRNYEESARWNTVGAARGRTGNVTRPGPRDIQSLEDVRTALDRAALRISGLFMALHEALPRYQELIRPKGWTSNMPRYLALMNDQFDLDQEGNWEVHRLE